MQAQAYFTNIRAVIIENLSKATESIYTAVAWVTDKELLLVLEQKLKKGISINLLIVKDHINEYQKDQIDQLQSDGASIYWLSETEEDKLMHHKFCVIDRTIVLMGSYNWSIKAATKNYEDMTVITGSMSFAANFIKEFELIIDNHFKETPKELTPQSITILLKRLEVIKTLIAIGDIEDIKGQIRKLEAYKQDNSIQAIYEALTQNSYGAAATLIANFLQHSQQLDHYLDPAISGLRLEMQMLEVEITAISNEYNELQQVIHQFSVRHTKELGEIIKKILSFRKLKLEKEALLDATKQSAFESAKQDYNDYYQNFESSKKEIIKDLNAEEQKELKKLYRKASLMCHPDKVATELEAAAQLIFIDLNKAYQSNDLKRIQEICKELKNGIPFVNKSVVVTELLKLQNVVVSLRKKRQEWLKSLSDLKSSNTYIKVNSIEDWDIYFKEAYEVLKEELELLDNELLPH